MIMRPVQGGLWLLADADSEIAAAEAIYGVGTQRGPRLPFRGR